MQAHANPTTGNGSTNEQQYQTWSVLILWDVYAQTYTAIFVYNALVDLEAAVFSKEAFTQYS